MKLSLTKTARALARCRRGNFSVIFALALLPMIGILGLAFDFGQTMRVKTALDASADAAALAAVNEASAIMQTQSPGYDPTQLAIYYGQQAGNLMFQTNAGRFSSSGYQYNTTVTKNGLVLNSTATYTAQSPNAFGKIFNSPFMKIAGTSASALPLKKYINIYVVVDVSQSMGIAASTSDMATLYQAIAATPNQYQDSSSQGNGCVFGCHVLQNGQTSGKTNEQIAHGKNVSLRIDVIKTAISNMIAQAQASEQQLGGATVSIGLYTMEQDLKTLTSPVDVSNNYSTLQSYVCPLTTSTCSNGNVIDLGSESGAAGNGDTYTQTALADLHLPPNGDGSSPSTPQNFVFIMTDGTYDTNGLNYGNPCVYGNHCVGPYDPSWTSALKNNATVGIIYTTFLPVYQNNNSNQPLWYSYQALLCAPVANPNPPVNGPISDSCPGQQPTIHSQIQPALQASASSAGWFIEASNASDINAALTNLFSKAALAGRLTQ